MQGEELIVHHWKSARKCQMRRREVHLPRSFPLSSLSSSSRTSSDQKFSKILPQNKVEWNVEKPNTEVVGRDSTSAFGSALVCGLPECSSLTREDTVLVMESAATRRSFLRFLLEPENKKNGTKRNRLMRWIRHRKQLWTTDQQSRFFWLEFIFTLRKCFLNVTAHPGERILRRVRVRVRRRSTHRAHAGRAGSTGGGVRGTSCLSLRDGQRTFRNVSRFSLQPTLNVPKAAILLIVLV